MRVLLAVNDTQPSWEAIKSVGARPWPPETIVRVLSTVEYLVPEPPECWYYAGDTLERIRQEMIKLAESITGQAVILLANQGLRAEAVVREGPPRIVIVEEAKKWNADLIIVGSRGGSGLRCRLLGSVAESIVRHAPCSVEVIQQRLNS